MKHKKCLLLNKDYTPLEVLSWKRALYHFYKGELRVECYYEDDFVQSGRDIHQVPAVMVCKEYVKKRKQQRPKSVSKSTIYARDRYTCSYCGFKDETCRRLTIDHIIPKSRWNEYGDGGSVNSATNLTTSCEKCNQKIKGDKLLSECGLKLRSVPTVPKASYNIKGFKPYMTIEEEWKPYLKHMFKNKEMV